MKVIRENNKGINLTNKQAENVSKTIISEFQ